jgi:hypothetical protein
MDLAGELPAEAVTHPKVRRMYEYWLAKRAGRRMPSRSDIDPLELPDCRKHPRKAARLSRARVAVRGYDGFRFRRPPRLLALR